MRPKLISTPAAGETDMFRNRLDNMIDMRHELVRLAGLIEWKRFDEAFGALYAEKGRPGLPTRLMVGLHMLKHARGISDDQSARSGSKTRISSSSAERRIFRPSCRSIAPRCRSGGADRGGQTRTPAGRNSGRRDAGEGGRQIPDGARHRRHDGADQSGGASHR